MQTESVLDAQRGSSARNPSGLRRLSLAMLATERTGETFTGLPEKSTPGRVLAAFKAAAPALGYGPRVIHAIDWLFSFTQPQDWTAGQKPIVWPSGSVFRVSRSRTSYAYCVTAGPSAILSALPSANCRRLLHRAHPQ